MAPAADIDRLIEDGLNRYGSGDLDGALLIWEEALAIDPDNAQANSYVDYVRMNYEVLQTDSALGVSSEPFGIEEEPEYIIEITQGHELLEAEAPAPLYMDPLDQGWFIEEEQTREVLAARTRSKNMPVEPRTISADPISADSPTVRESMQVLEMEADEPPELELAPPPPTSGGEVSFDSATREYGSDEHEKPRSGPPPAGTNEFAEELSSFSAESTPLGFGNLETEIKKRDLGFVQPTHGPAQLEVRLRTPTSPPQHTLTTTPIDLELGGAGADNDIYKTSRGIAPITRSPAVSATSSEDDLIKSLPSPRKVTPVRGSQPMDERPRITTRDLPDKKRPPAEIDRAATKQGGDDEDIALPNATTRDLGLQPNVMNAINAGNAGAVPGPPTLDDFSVSAPTQELGLRPGGRPASVYPDEDAPTRQSDARQIRDEHTTQKLKAQKKQKPNPTGGAQDGTRTDYVLPFDPIDARTDQILKAIETSEPPNESKDDRTRRRISALIEHATTWSGQGELDKAVAAVDLALSEDPNSALAQKLIHRNRDAIMNIFQAYLGDLERQPQLARPLHELAEAPISPRAAFLLSRIDGMLTIDEILDVSGMPRLEAYRHLAQLFLRGILR